MNYINFHRDLRLPFGISYGGILICPMPDVFSNVHPMKHTFELVLATRNPGKISEIRALLADLPVVLHAADDFPDAPEVDEDAPTLEGNARKKAVALRDHTGHPALGDDTGLEVTALDGRPGVYSARYAGPNCDPAANRVRLREEMADAADRSAQFRTVVALALEDQVHYFEGICRGHICEAERGSSGFGYDALFVPEGHTRTFAELTAEEKNAVSHRGRALRNMSVLLRSIFETNDRTESEHPV